MTVTAFDGFDSYNGVGVSPGLQAKWTAIGSSDLSLVAGRFGGQALKTDVSSTATSATRDVTAVGSMAIGFAMRVDTLSTKAAGSVFVHFSLLDSVSAARHFGFRVNLNRAIEVFKMTAAATGVLLGTSANAVVTVGVWHYIELEIVISDTVGVVNVYVDGVSVLALSAQDTRNGGATAQINQVQFGMPTAATNSGGINSFDDFYITDTAAKLGEQKVEPLAPNADVVGSTDWTPSTGANHYATVDEAIVDVTDYNSATTVGNKDRFTHAGMGTTPASISAVQAVSYGLKTDATARSIANQVKSGATTSDGANFALAATTQRFERLMTTDPNTGAAWTAAAVNALEFGVKVTV